MWFEHRSRVVDDVEAGFNAARYQAGQDVPVTGRLLRPWLLAATLACQLAAVAAAVTPSYAGTPVRRDRSAWTAETS